MVVHVVHYIRGGLRSLGNWYSQEGDMPYAFLYGELGCTCNTPAVRYLSSPTHRVRRADRNYGVTPSGSIVRSNYDKYIHITGRRTKGERREKNIYIYKKRAAGSLNIRRVVRRTRFWNQRFRRHCLVPSFIIHAIHLPLWFSPSFVWGIHRSRWIIYLRQKSIPTM